MRSKKKSDSPKIKHYGGKIHYPRCTHPNCYCGIYGHKPIHSLPLECADYDKKLQREVRKWRKKNGRRKVIDGGLEQENEKSNYKLSKPIEWVNTTKSGH